MSLGKINRLRDVASNAMMKVTLWRTCIDGYLYNHHGRWTFEGKETSVLWSKVR